MSPGRTPTIIHCPDCGGIVGARETTDAGYPCTCVHVAPDLNFVPAPVSNAHMGDPYEENSGTQMLDSPVQGPPKVCWKCGKDLRGHRRLKDSHGYWCINCHREDQEKEKLKGVECPICHRTVRPETLTMVDGVKRCSRCTKEHREIRKAGAKKFRAISSKAFEREDKKRIMVLVLIFIAIALFVYFSGWGRWH